MDPRPLRVIAVFRAAGWRYPLREGDHLEIYRGIERLGTLPAVLLFQIVGHYLYGASLTRELTETLPVKPLTKVVSARPLLHTGTRRLRGYPR